MLDIALYSPAAKSGESRHRFRRVCRVCLYRVRLISLENLDKIFVDFVESAGTPDNDGTGTPDKFGESRPNLCRDYRVRRYACFSLFFSSSYNNNNASYNMESNDTPAGQNNLCVL